MVAAVPLVAAVAGAGVSTALAGIPLGVLAGSAAGGLASLGVTSALIGSAAGFVVSSAINMAGGAFTAKKAKAPSLSGDANSVQSTSRSSVQSHRIIYGQALVSGVVVFDGATSSGLDNNGASVTGDDKFRHFVIALAGHEVEEIGTIYIENKAVTLDGDGFVTDAPYISAQTSETQHSATLSTVANSTGGVLFTTTAAHGFVTGETVYVPFSGRDPYRGYAITDVPTATTFTIATGPQISGITVAATYPVYVKRTSSTDTRFIRIKKFLGTDSQTASSDLASEISDWTTDHRLRGIAYIYVRIQQAPEFAMNIQNVAALVKGKKVYDSRTATTAWSANAVLCIRDYLTGTYGFDCDSDEINDTYTDAAANLCDESVTLQDASTQARYTCNGVLDTAAGLFDNLSALLTSCAGNVTYVQGQFRINPAAYEAPAGTITEDMLAGPIQSQARPSRKELFNAVRGTFIDPAKNYTVTDFPVVTNSTYESQDGGERIVRDIELPFTNHGEAAQRLSKIILETARQGITVTMPLNHSALQFAVNDTVYVNNTRRGWSNKIFRIKKFNLGVPGPFTVTLQEEASAAYDWNSGEATVEDPAPDTNLPDPFIVSAPGAPSVTEELYETRASSGVKARAAVTWSASQDPYARYYVLEYRRIEALDWIVLQPTENTTVQIPDISPGVYDFRVKAINHIGRASDYATSDPREIFGLSARPADITGFTIQALWGRATLKWDLPTDLDVTSGGKILVRHSEASTGATWEDSTSIGHEDIAGNANSVTLPLKAGTYLIKAQDSSGLTSVNAATVTTKNISPVAFSTLTTVQEDSTFTGTHSGTIADGGVLKLTGSLDVDDILDVDSITNWDSAGGVRSSGTYTSATITDYGSVQTFRVRSVIELSTVNDNDLIDSRSGFIDDWLDFDGTSGGGSVDCWMEVRTTDDDPGGTPTWSDWNRADVADLSARAWQPRWQLRSSDVSFNPYISTLRAIAEEA